MKEIVINVSNGAEIVTDYTTLDDIPEKVIYNETWCLVPLKGGGLCRIRVSDIVAIYEAIY